MSDKKSPEPTKKLVFTGDHLSICLGRAVPNGPLIYTIDCPCRVCPCVLYPMQYLDHYVCYDWCLCLRCQSKMTKEQLGKAKASKEYGHYQRWVSRTFQVP